MKMAPEPCEQMHLGNYKTRKGFFLKHATDPRCALNHQRVENDLLYDRKEKVCTDIAINVNNVFGRESVFEHFKKIVKNQRSRIEERKIVPCNKEHFISLWYNVSFLDWKYENSHHFRRKILLVVATFIIALHLVWVQNFFIQFILRNRVKIRTPDLSRFTSYTVAGCRLWLFCYQLGNKTLAIYTQPLLLMWTRSNWMSSWHDIAWHCTMIRINSINPYGCD